MKKKPAKYFKSIVDVFDNLEGKNGEKCLISDYCIFEAGFYKLNPEDIEEDDPWFDMVNDLFKAAFAIGYVFGQSFDIPYPEIRKDVEAVKKVLKDEKLLPYFPREKKTA